MLSVLILGQYDSLGTALSNWRILKSIVIESPSGKIESLRIVISAGYFANAEKVVTKMNIKIHNRLLKIKDKHNLLTNLVAGFFIGYIYQ